MTSAPYIRTGAMRHRADLQSRTEVADGGGGVSVTWATERALWCAINPLEGRERTEAMRQESPVTHEIYARYASDITADKRLVHSGTVYNIRSVFSPKQRKEFIVILAESGVAT